MSKKTQRELRRKYEERLVREGKARQEKYAKMNNLQKCGYVSPSYDMFMKVKGQKVHKKKSYEKGQRTEVRIIQ